MPTMLAAVARAAGIEIAIDEVSSANTGIEQPAAPAAPQPAQPASDASTADDLSSSKLADAARIAADARAYQDQCAARGFRISTQEALRHAMVSPSAGNAPAAGGDPASPVAIAAFYNKIVADWGSTPALRKTHSTYAAYLVARQTEYCRTHAVGMEALQGDTDPVQTFINNRAAFSPLGAASIARVQAAHATWAKSPDLRREFLSFHVFAAKVLQG